MSIRFAIMLTLLITSPCAMAERISFVEVSKQLSHNEIIDSPIYVKKIYRQMYEEDKAAYDRQMRALDSQKKAGQISSRTYLYRTEALRKTFKKAYPTSLSEQGEFIEKAPVDMFNFATFSNHRRQLIKLTHPEYRQITKDTISGKNITQAKEQNTKQTATQQKKQQVKNTQKLGRKSFSINTDTFK